MFVFRNLDTAEVVSDPIADIQCRASVLKNGMPRRDFLCGLGTAIGVAALETVAGGGCARLWEEGGPERVEGKERLIVQMPISAAVLPDSRIAVFYTLTGGRTEAVFKIIDPRSGGEEGPYLVGNFALASDVAVAPDRLAIVTQSLGGSIIVKLLSPRARGLRDMPPAVVNREDPRVTGPVEVVRDPSIVYCSGLGGYVVAWRSKRREGSMVFFNMVGENGQKFDEHPLLENSAAGDGLDTFSDDNREVSAHSLRGDTAAIVVGNLIYVLNPRTDTASIEIHGFSSSVWDVVLLPQHERRQVIIAGIDGESLKIVRLGTRTEPDRYGGHPVLELTDEPAQVIAENVANFTSTVLPGGDVLFAWADPSGKLYWRKLSEADLSEVVEIARPEGATVLFPVFAEAASEAEKPEPLLAWLEQRPDKNGRIQTEVRAMVLLLTGDEDSVKVRP